MKQWKLRDTAPNDYQTKFVAYHPIITQLLYNRNLISQLAIDYFFNPEYEKLHDPFLFNDMEKAVQRIWLAIDNKEKILIHGDYDADGVTSAAILFRALKLLGAEIEVFIPHREDDGYGLNMDNLNNFSVQGVKLLITVDCGVTNTQEIASLNAMGIDVIVTDHHEPPLELPTAYAILDPKVEDSGYPFKDLAGAGVAFKLVQAILKDESRMVNYADKFKDFGGTEGFQKWLLDIVAIGTVADVSPIIGENRILVKWGLIVLRQTKWLGLQKLLEIINSKRVDSFTISFQIAPRLNAAGRMNHASFAYELLVSENAIEADHLALKLQKNNQERQKVIEGALIEARQQLSQFENENIFFLFNENWQTGIIGLIAGKLSDEFYRPVMAMTISNQKVVGSGRSIEGCNITAGLHTVSNYLARFGGHAGACGFTLTQIEIRQSFESEYKKYIDQQLQGIELQPALYVDAEIKTNQIDFDFLEQLEKFAPFGEGNSRPLFIIRNLQIVAMDAIGQDKTHLRFSAKQDGPQLYKMLWFGKAKEWLEKLRIGDTIDTVCELGINEWNGNREFEFKLVDLKVKVSVRL